MLVGAANMLMSCQSSNPGFLVSGVAVSVTGPYSPCCGYGTGNNVIDGLMPGYSTRGLLTHRAVNPLCIDERPTSTGMGDTDTAV